LHAEKSRLSPGAGPVRRGDSALALGKVARDQLRQQRAAR
jgi:hypothetical protein